MSHSYKFSVFILLLVILSLFTNCNQNKMNVLVFSKTAGYRHESIREGIKALSKMAEEKKFKVTFTEDASFFTEQNLKSFHAVVFLNTTGDVLNEEQQEAFERYIQAGGGYAGIHAATDTEYDWPWYNQLAGAWFLDHPNNPSNVQEGKFYVALKNQFTAGMPDTFKRKDEFYSFRNISPRINVLLKIDEKSYLGGKNGEDHAMSWYHEFDGGRSFYTAMGHTSETYTEPLFLNHIWEGIRYAAGGETPQVVEFTKSRPEENRFTKVVLEENLDEPTELTILDKDRILFIQRKGEVRLYNLVNKTLKTIAKIPVSTMYKNAEGKESMGEDGLLGLNKDPDFKNNQWIYLYYSSTKGVYNVLSRFKMKGDELILSSEIEMLKVEVQREECCHTGGSIDWDKDGNLYLSTGDNTNPFTSNGYSPTDERPGRSPWDAQKSSANTNDLRGKIIRIKPQSDGSYTIPSGNLFPNGTPGTRPEIYTMGHRNPYRIHVDKKTGFVYWGDVGPDANEPKDDRGPAGYDEVGQARQPGNFGWPHFIGDNKAYNKFDFTTNKSLEKWDVNGPSNNSPNNTGLKILPPAQKAFIWYPYAESPEFPLLGSGGRNAMAGPVYHKEEFKNGERAFPKYYDGKFFQYEWMRGWIMSVTMDKEGNYVSMERFMPGSKFANPMDMEFAENGDLYMLEYGSGWFTLNADARLIRIEYNGGNRPPQINMAASQMSGALPFQLSLSSAGTKDADHDKLKYTWNISSENGYKKDFNSPEVNVTLDKEGKYNVLLTVDDGQNGKSYKAMEVVAGNDPPSLQVEMLNKNRSFFTFNKPLNYEIKVADKEDGSIGQGIEAQNVALTIDYLAEGYDRIEIAQGHRLADAGAFAPGLKLIENSDCKSCHSKEEKSIGPTYMDIAKKYKGDATAQESLIGKIRSGGGGVWGETVMAGHPNISKSDAGKMVKYILSLGNIEKTKPLPLAGKLVPSPITKNNKKGVYIMRAAYEDKGHHGLPPQKSEQTFVLRNSNLDPHAFDVYKDIKKMTINDKNIVEPGKTGAYLSLADVDLNGLTEISLFAYATKPQLKSAGGQVELRLGGPYGNLIGTSVFFEPTEKLSFTPRLLKIPVNTSPEHLKKNQDIFLVFVNPDAGNNPLMAVTGIEFRLK